MRRVLLVALLALAPWVVPVPATAAVAPAEELAQRYAPVVMVRAQDDPCDRQGEPYRPIAVDAVLGNPQVALRQVGNGDAVIRWAPTARDLHGLGTGVYLDFPGDALRPGCVFAADSARYAAAGTTVYAHVARQPDRPGFLALQFWFYWYYNDWNDKHESDWEFVQLLFRASTVDEALAGRPESVGFAQHEGGEVVPWTSDRLERDGDHPVVYASERSHASYTEPALFLGRGASEGFGCDDTEGPSTRLRPDVVLLPDAPSGPDDPLAWLAFSGRWGERHAAPNDGPTGPASKPQWTEPVRWQEGLRESSVPIPGGSAGGPRVVDAFCAVVGGGSVLLVGIVASPARTLALLAVLAALLWFLLSRTSWRRVDPEPLVARRRAGEIVRAAVAVYRRRPAAFVAAGVVAVPVGVLAAVLSAVLVHLPVLGPAVRVSDDDAGVRALVSSAVAAALLPVTFVLAAAVVALLLGRDAGPAAAYRAVGRAVPALASSFVPAALAVALLSLTVVGLPVAPWLAVRFAFLPQVTMLEEVRGRRALARSAALVRGRWWHTATVVALVWLGVRGAALALALLLLVLLPGLPLWTVSAVLAATEVVLVPLAATCLTYLYADARAAAADRGLT